MRRDYLHISLCTETLFEAIGYELKMNNYCTSTHVLTESIMLSSENVRIHLLLNNESFRMDHGQVIHIISFYFGFYLAIW